MLVGAVSYHLHWNRGVLCYAVGRAVGHGEPARTRLPIGAPPAASDWRQGRLAPCRPTRHQELALGMLALLADALGETFASSCSDRDLAYAVATLAPKFWTLHWAAVGRAEILAFEEDVLKRRGEIERQTRDLTNEMARRKYKLARERKAREREQKRA